MQMRGEWKRIVAGLVVGSAMLGMGAWVAADDLVITATASPQQVRAGEQIQLVVAIDSQGNLRGEPQLPDLSEFQVFSGGRSTSFNFINGQVSSSMRFTYVLVPKHSGQLTIGPVTISRGGKTYSTAPIQVTVGNAASGYTPPSQQGGGGARPQAAAPQNPAPSRNDVSGHGGDAVFITTSVDRKVAYVNEPILLTFRFYTRLPILSQPQYSPPDTTGFWCEDLPPQRDYTTQVNGQDYRVIEIRNLMYPTTSGKLTVSPAKLLVQVQDFERQSDPFADNFFRGFFSGGQQVTLQSKPIAVEVKPVPEAGKPADFTGTVGKWSLSARLDRAQAKVGDAVTLELRIFGEGNVKSVNKPNLPAFSGFKVYETVSSSEVQKKGDTIQGVKIYRTLLRPEVSGNLSIPGIAYSYFNPWNKKFEQVKVPSLNLKVLPGEAKPGEPQLGGGNVQPSGPGVKMMAKDIRYLKTELPLKAPAESLPSWFWILGFLLPPALLFAFWNWQRHQDRLIADPRYARKVSASRSARQALKLARQARLHKDTKGFYAALAQALAGYLADELGMSRSGATQREIIQRLNALGAGAALVQELSDLFDEADFARFAEGSREAGEMARHEQQAEAVLTRLSRLLRQERK